MKKLFINGDPIPVIVLIVFVLIGLKLISTRVMNLGRKKNMMRKKNQRKNLVRRHQNRNQMMNRKKSPKTPTPTPKKKKKKQKRRKKKMKIQALKDLIAKSNVG